MSAKKKSKSEKSAAVSHEAYGNHWSGVASGSIADVEAVELALGVRLPLELSELLRECGGAHPGRDFYYNAEYDREVQLGYVLPLRDSAKQRGLVAQCLVQRKVHSLPSDLVPFAIDFGNSDYICLNLQTGEIVYWVHDTKGEHAIVVAPTLSHLLAELQEPPY